MNMFSDYVVLFMLHSILSSMFYLKTMQMKQSFDIDLPGKCHQQCCQFRLSADGDTLPAAQRRECSQVC